MSDPPQRPRRATPDPPAWWPGLIPWPNNFTAAVYGSVLAASVIVASGTSHTGWGLTITLLVTGFVFWLAHVYAETVASVHGGWQLGAIGRGMRHEWPLMFASVPPAAVAAASNLFPNLTPLGGAWAALIVAILEQQIWALAAARRAGLGRGDIARTVVLNIVLGAIIVGLKVAVPGH